MAAVFFVGAWPGSWPADAAVRKSEVPTSMHGAVETQAITVGNGALSLLVDPGTAYAYSTLDYDDYGEDSESFTMTARGANVNLGTIAYAVLWAPPNCTTNNVPCFLSGSYNDHMPNTGLHEAKGFPAYAEALYPPPPASDAESQERVYKCIVNKDGPGSPPGNGEAQRICKDNPEVPMSAWAETIAEEYRASGFSRAAGFDQGILAVRGSESRSDVRAVGEKKVRSMGYSNVSGISVLDGWIRVDNVFSEAAIVSSDMGVEQPKSFSSCSVAGLTVAGQMFPSQDLRQAANPQLQAALDQVAAETNIRVEIIAPTAIPVSQVDEGKFVTGCSGLQIKLTDANNQSPVPCSPAAPPGAPNCLPAIGNREELSFGRISVQQSVNEFEVFSDGEGAGGLDDLGGDSGGLGGVDELADTGGGDFAAAGDGTDLAVGAGAGGGSDASVTESGGSGSASGGARRSVTRGRSGAGADAEEIVETSNARTIGAMTAAGGAGLLVGVLALVGVVNALAGGRRFRLPGF